MVYDAFLLSIEPTVPLSIVCIIIVFYVEQFISFTYRITFFRRTFNKTSQLSGGLFDIYRTFQANFLMDVTFFWWTLFYTIIYHLIFLNTPIDREIRPWGYLPPSLNVLTPCNASCGMRFHTSKLFAYRYIATLLHNFFSQSVREPPRTLSPDCHLLDISIL